MRDTPDVASAGSNEAPQSSLTDAQVSEFWAGIVANTDAATRMARKYVPKQDVEDVVHTASILFKESLERPVKPARFPKDDGEFRARFLTIVRNHALDCIRESDNDEGSGLKYWGVEMEPLVGGRKTPDRPLDQVFARNDTDKYDAPAVAETQPKDSVDKLRYILRAAAESLPPQQRMVITETFFRGHKRAEVARRHGMSVNTYDNHLRAAYDNLFSHLWAEALSHGEPDRSVWYDRIEMMADRKMSADCQRILEGLKLIVKRSEEAERRERAGDDSSAVDAA